MLILDYNSFFKYKILIKENILINYKIRIKNIYVIVYILVNVNVNLIDNSFLMEIKLYEGLNSCNIILF